MRNFLAFVGAAVLTFAGIGWYLGWYDVKREAATPGHSRLQLDINQDKISIDVKEGTEKIKDTIEKHAPEANSTDKKPTGSDALLAPAPTGPGKTTSQEKAKDAAKDAFKDLIIDGWFTQPEKK